MAISMSVGATRIQILQENSLASLAKGEFTETQLEQEGESTAAQETCST